MRRIFTLAALIALALCPPHIAHAYTMVANSPTGIYEPATNSWRLNYYVSCSLTDFREQQECSFSTGEAFWVTKDEGDVDDQVRLYVTFWPEVSCYPGYGIDWGFVGFYFFKLYQYREHGSDIEILNYTVDPAITSEEPSFNPLGQRYSLMIRAGDIYYWDTVGYVGGYGAPAPESNGMSAVSQFTLALQKEEGHFEEEYEELEIGLPYQIGPVYNLLLQ